MGTRTLEARRVRAIALTLVVSIAVGWEGTATAQTPDNSWIGAGASGNWLDGGNWTDSTPTSSNVVGFDGTALPFQPTLDVDPTVAGMLMNGANTLTLNGHTLTLTGTGTQSAGTHHRHRHD